MKLAVLGLGSIGLRHAGNLLALGHGVAGYDPDPERRRLLAERGGDIAESREAALARGEAAVIATPNGCHGEDLAACVDAGRPAMVEKPLAHRLDGLDGLLARAERRGLVVFVAQNLRLHPCVRAARAVLESGGLGRPLWARLFAASYLPDWRPGQDYRAGYAADPRSGGAAFDFIHEFDLAAHLLGPFETVAATARNSGTLGIDSEDCVDAVLRHRDGVVSTLHVDYVTRPAGRVTEVAGTEGLMRLDLAARRFQQLDVRGRPVVDRSWDSAQDDDYVDEMKAFLASLAGQARPPCDGREALAILAEVIRARALAGLPQA